MTHLSILSDDLTSGTSTFSSVDEYIQQFRADFRRKDRYFWATIYLKGLLSASGRKNIEGIVRAVALPEDVRIEDACQSLQNFIQESPWDEQQVMRRYRQLVVQLLGSEGILVVEDVVLLKQGQHSVGVHRQFSSEQKKKVNCQILTTVFLAAKEHVAPLAFRLYLPRAWREDASRLAKSRVPAGKGAIVSKVDVADELLEMLRSEQLPYEQVVAGESYSRSGDFLERVKGLGMRLLSTEQTGSFETRRVQALSTHLKERLGLDHFEGRTWRGLHHHLSLVALAYGCNLVVK